MMLTLDALNVPTTLTTLIYPIDWFLDRIRTPVNVYGNVISTGIVSHFLDKQEAKMKKGKGAQKVESNGSDLSIESQKSTTGSGFLDSEFTRL